MASYHPILQQAKPRFESPAKVFAKLKSKVQRQELCAKEGILSNVATEPLYAEKHGGDFTSPRKTTESTWMTEELKENQRFGPYRKEAQILTLSPIKSPQKTCGASFLDFSSKPLEEATPFGGYTPRKKAFLESTAVHHPNSVFNRTTHTEQPHRHLDGAMVSGSRTPVKIQPEGWDCRRGVCVEECVPDSVFSPMRKRLRKRKLEQQDFNKVSNEVISQPQERKTSSACSEDDIPGDTYMEDLGHVRRFSADQPGMSQFSHEALLPSMPTAVKRCQVVAEKFPPMSPAKMFAYMKERKSKAEQQEAHQVSSSTRDLFDENDFHQSRGTSPSFIPEYMKAPDSMGPANQSPEKSADSQSDTDPSEDVLNPAEPLQPVLLEDPLVLNSPRITIPKKQATVFKRNKWPQTVKFPCESVIHLKKWYLSRNHKGIYVQGNCQDNNVPWTSNIILDRVNNHVLKTVSGRVYILVGKMNLKADSGFPKWFLKKFVDGFPANWKALYEKFLSEKNRGTTRNSEASGNKARTKSETSSVSVKQHRQKPLKTPASCPPAPVTSNQVSRSGRTIKPPLEYWKGGRVILDAHMNVTIHECYESSICIPEVSTRVSARASRKPARVFLPCAGDQSRSELTSNQQEPAPQRRVKAQVSKSNRAKVNLEEKPLYLPEPPVEVKSSPDEGSSRMTRSSRRRPAPEKRLYVDAVQQMEPEKYLTKKSKNQTQGTAKHSGRVSKSKRDILSSSASPSAHDQSSDDEVLFRRTRRENNKRGGKDHNKPRQNRLSSSLSAESFEESEKELNRRTKGTKNNDATQTQVRPKQSKCTKISPPTKPQPKVINKKEKRNKGNTQIQDDDQFEWTEVELTKLREAVSYYPKNMAGYWAKVARMVGTRSVEECRKQLMSKVAPETPAKKQNKPTKQKVEAPKDQEVPLISARAGTLKRKQQVRQFLKSMPREDVDDVFTSAYMHQKQFGMPSICSSEDLDCAPSDQMPRTPGSAGFPDAKTPQCLDVRPDMIDSPNTSNDDKYTYQLQKRMRKNQYNVCKQAPSAKILTPSAKRTMKRCGNTENDTFVVWEMFPANDAALSDSGEEEDFYFSDN
ncbi:mis18-binding protein 1 [Cheilinus undulatus]|uniref:mis18-binding protein 1 n=1 Tax=Cheilinus undulatus TaxID=241271 RepID=UPI001BD3FA12|nr:mis18-binding protein 1 [Cheilinus undulatus]